MFEFAEKNHTIEKDGKHTLYQYIPEGDEQRKEIAVKRGYTQTKWGEVVSVMDIQDRPKVQLPAGFSIKTGLEVTNVEQGLAHAKAFGYIDEEKYTTRSKVGYGVMRNIPDYRADLDLLVLSLPKV
ncbi:MAG: hypothetical protein KAX49_17545 [Halanaerobiales bacterium]|nr:hypothetical protein [Halanaerobiales bacterium]